MKAGHEGKRDPIDRQYDPEYPYILCDLAHMLQGCLLSTVIGCARGIDVTLRRWSSGRP